MVSDRTNFKLSTEQTMDAREAFRLLSGHNLSLRNAVEIALAQIGIRGVQTTTYELAMDLFIRDRIKRELRQSSIEYYMESLAMFSPFFDGKQLSQITRNEAEEILNANGVSGRPLSTSTKLLRWRALRAMWSWAAEQTPPLVDKNLFLGRPMWKQPTRNIAILSPEQVAELFVSSTKPHRVGRTRSAGVRHALALAFFAGIRPEELGPDTSKARLDWSTIDRAAKIIRVPADVSKTGNARILEKIPDTLWAWIKDAPAKGPVLSGASWRSVRSSVIRSAGWKTRERENGNPGKTTVHTRWGQDAARHSFASYALALCKEPGTVSLWLGHEEDTTMLYRNYRALVTEERAKAYFAITPESTGVSV